MRSDDDCCRWAYGSSQRGRRGKGEPVTVLENENKVHMLYIYYRGKNAI